MEKNKLFEYAEIIKDENCLKILYYLYKYNPDIPIKEINEQLHIPIEVTSLCIDRLVKAGIIFKSSENDKYTMTPFGRNAFRQLFQED